MRDHRHMELDRQSRGLFLVLLLVMLPVFSCDEDLPPRNDPTSLFTARLEPTWSLTAVENRISIRLILVNSYDEIIEGTEDIEGAISITLAGDPSYTRTYELSGLSVDHVPVYNRSTGFISIPPGDSISFFIPWDWHDDLGRDTRGVFRYAEDPTCAGRRIAARETIIIRGEGRPFRRISLAAAPATLFDICHADVWVNPKYCPPITGPTDGCR